MGVVRGSLSTIATGHEVRLSATDASVADERESRLRVMAGAAIAFMLFVAGFGLAWDIRWHIVVGRDTFFTPPHLLLYTGIAVAGLVCLGMVLAETWRYRQGSPAVTSHTTTPFLGLFHAPVGFVVAGFGLLTLLLAAPLDNYWHELYGIDVALWTPFHMMGMIGGFIAGLGTVHIFASEAARARRRGRWRVRFMGFTGTEWAVLFTISMLVAHLMVAAMPSTNQFPTTIIGPLEFLTYPVLLGMFLPAAGVAAIVATRRAGAASLVFALFFLRQFVFGVVVPWAVWWLINGDPSQLRVVGWRPGINWVDLMYTALLLLPMVVIDLAAIAARRPDKPRTLLPAVAGMAAAVPLLLVAPIAVRTAITGARQMQLPASIIVGGIPPLGALWQAVPITLVVSALSALIGFGWGSFLRAYDK
jgi:hypothetical protein